MDWFLQPTGGKSTHEKHQHRGVALGQILLFTQVIGALGANTATLDCSVIVCRADEEIILQFHIGV